MRKNRTMSSARAREVLAQQDEVMERIDQVIRDEEEMNYGEQAESTGN